MNKDTIAAISTPAGTGGIAVIRLSGNEAIVIADKVWKGKSLKAAASHTVHFGSVLDTENNRLDECVATVFIAPASFTGENTVEFAVHGSQYVQRELMSALIKAGARLAEPGEFTRRAFLAGKMGLTQAEAVADIIASDSRASHRLAMAQLDGNFGTRLAELRSQLLDLLSLMELELDFSEEEVTFANRDEIIGRVDEIRAILTRLVGSFAIGNAIKNGIPVAIVGPTNAGKSSLLNSLLEHDRAIVSDIHGTTRDTIEETVHIGDYLFRFIDTAGMRDTDDSIERLGIERSRRALRHAHIVISVIDLSNPKEGLSTLNEQRKNLSDDQKLIIVANKCDLAGTDGLPEEAIVVSTLKNQGINSLRDELVRIMAEESSNASSDIIITNQRHVNALRKALNETEKMLAALSDGISTELVAMDARAVLETLGEITGQITSSDILANIFSRFCIGK